MPVSACSSALAESDPRVLSAPTQNDSAFAGFVVSGSAGFDVGADDGDDVRFVRAERVQWAGSKNGVVAHSRRFRAVSRNRIIGGLRVLGVQPDRFEHEVEFIYRRC